MTMSKSRKQWYYWFKYLKILYSSISITIRTDTKPQKTQLPHTNSTNIETGLSDFHLMAICTMRSFFPKQTLIVVKYWSYRKFNKNIFNNELQYRFSSIADSSTYDEFEAVFVETLNKHAPLKEKNIRANNYPFMNKIISKAIMNRSRLKNRFLKYFEEHLHKKIIFCDFNEFLSFF